MSVYRQYQRTSAPAVGTHVMSALATLEKQTDCDPGVAARTRGPVAARDANGCRVTNRQDARSKAVIAMAETWAFGGDRRAASGEDDATGTTCRTASLYIDWAGI